MSGDIEKRFDCLWIGILLLFTILLFNILCIRYAQEDALKNTQQHFILIEKHLKIIK